MHSLALPRSLQAGRGRTVKDTTLGAALWGRRSRTPGYPPAASRPARDGRLAGYRVELGRAASTGARSAGAPRVYRRGVAMVGNGGRAEEQILPLAFPRAEKDLALRLQIACKSLISMVGAQGLEPWTR